MICERYLTIGVIVLVLLVGTMMYSAAQGVQANFYVATNGNDAWSGTLPAPNAAKTDGPFATLTRARDAIREVKANGGLHQPLKVLVRGGTYYLPETFTLGPEDSGAASFPITYMGYAGEKVVLSGGRPVTGWKLYRGKIWQCDLNALELGDVTFKQLFYNGERQPLARFPNVAPQRPRTGGFLYVAEGGIKDNKQLLKYDPAELDMSKWANPTLAQVDVYPYHNWNNNIISIAEIDFTSHIIKLAGNASYDLIRDTRFYIQNVFEELDAPGEWYLDSEAGMLYFWPPDDNLAQSQVVVPALDDIIQTQGSGGGYVRHLRIGGFAIQACRRSAVVLQSAQHCTLAKCTITNTRNDGVVLHANVSDSQLVGNDIAHIGSIGIKIAGQGNVISNNHLHDMGVIRNSFNRAITIAGRDNVASHNLIHDVPAWGVVFGGHNNILEHNDIHHFGLCTNLGGGVYAWVKGLEDAHKVGGNILRFNKVSDSVGYGMYAPGVWGPTAGNGIWLDDMISNTTLYGNILVRNKSCGVNIHGGADNLIENNIMGAGFPSTSNHIRPEDDPCHNRIIRNIVYYANADPRLVRRAARSARGIKETVASAAAVPVVLCGWSSVKAAVSESDYNLFFPISGQQVEALLYYRGAGEAARGSWADAPVEDRFAWWREHGYEAHSIIADPLFVDIENDDFWLKPDSPALQFGFTPIPQQRIGLYPSPNRASWPVPDQRDNPREELLLDLT